jgi:5-methyltetrahydropteroyltriglutamate--homocysteine methyltransferase
MANTTDTSKSAVLTLRADHVGSLIRSDALKALRAKLVPIADAVLIRNRKPQDLIAAEDEAVREVVTLQEATGLQVVTDGEVRRGSYYADFLRSIDGLQVGRGNGRITFVDGTKTGTIGASGKIRLPNGGVTIEDFKFLQSATHVTAKMTLPSPLHGQFLEDMHPHGTGYTNRDEFWADFTAAYRNEIALLAKAGCRYVQFDDTTFVRLCDPKHVAMLKEDGDDPIAAMRRWVAVLNACMKDRPAGMTFGVHFCRGNGTGGAWVSQGGYGPIAEIVFTDLNADRLLLEYDSDRAGGFDPLRHVGKDKVAVLGLVSTKDAHLEDTDLLKRRIDEAATFLPMAQLALSPQCGFASGAAGGQMGIDIEDKKLRRVVAVARDMWGSA